MKPTRHRPSTWEKITAIKVIDPDGWREDGKPWRSPLTKEQWEIRMSQSTCYLKPILKPPTTETF